jgi:hypothetical protein
MSTPEKNSNRPDPMAYGQGIPRGLGVNLLVHDVNRSAGFQAEIFGACILYWEEHFAIMRAVDSTWLLHSDWSYRNHELIGAVAARRREVVASNCASTELIPIKQRPLLGVVMQSFSPDRQTRNTGCARPISSTTMGTFGYRRSQLRPARRYPPLPGGHAGIEATP